MGHAVTIAGGSSYPLHVIQLHQAIGHLCQGVEPKKKEFVAGGIHRAGRGWTQAERFQQTKKTYPYQPRAVPSKESRENWNRCKDIGEDGLLLCIHGRQRACGHSEWLSCILFRAVLLPLRGGHLHAYPRTPLMERGERYHGMSIQVPAHARVPDLLLFVGDFRVERLQHSSREGWFTGIAYRASILTARLYLHEG